MRLALDYELAGGEVVKAKHTRLTADGKVLVGVRDGNRVQFVRLSAVRARLEDGLGVCLSQIPVGDLLFLSHSDEFVIIEWRD